MVELRRQGLAEEGGASRKKGGHESDDDVDDVLEAEDANGQCLGPDDDVRQREFSVQNSTTTSSTTTDSAAVGSTAEPVFARIARLRHLSDEYLRLEQDWQNTGNEESRVRRDEMRNELATLTGSIAPAAALATGPT